MTEKLTFEFDEFSTEIYKVCMESIKDFGKLVLKYVKSMDPGTDPLSEAAMKSMAAAIVEDLFTKIDDKLDSPAVAYQIKFALEQRVDYIQ